VIIWYLDLKQTTYAISADHHQRCEFKSRSWRDVLDTILCDKVCH